MGEQPKCYRCGREPSQQLTSGNYWCSWCGQAFDPKDEGRYRKAEDERKQEESKIIDRPTFTCQGCGCIVQPMYRRGNNYLFRGWRCTSCDRIFCDTCHSPTLGQPCECGSVQFVAIEIPDFSSRSKGDSKRSQSQLKQISNKKWWQFWK